jgi:hypothetical protein
MLKQHDRSAVASGQFQQAADFEFLAQAASSSYLRRSLRY